MPEPDRPIAWYPWSDVNVTFSLRGFNNALAAAPPDEQTRRSRQEAQRVRDEEEI